MPEWGFQDSVAQFTGADRGGLVGERALQPVRRGAVDARRLRADARHPDGAMVRRALGQGALARVPAASSRSSSSRPRTTGGSTRSPARWSPASAALAAVFFARLRPAAWAWVPPTARAGRALEFPRDVHPAARACAPPVGARVPDAGAQPADRVAADARTRSRSPGWSSASSPRGSSSPSTTSSAGSRSSSARSATRSTAATRGCRARGRASARSSTPRWTGWRRGSCSPRSPTSSPRRATTRRSPPWSSPCSPR